MRKLLLICSAMTLLNGSNAFGMDSDDKMDWEPTESRSELVQDEQTNFQRLSLRYEEEVKNLKRQLAELTQKFEKEQELRKQAEEEIKELKQQLANLSVSANATSAITQTTPIVQRNNSSVTQNQRKVSRKSTIVTMSVNGRKIPVLINGCNSNAEQSLKNDIEGRLFVMEDEKLGQHEIRSIIDSLDLNLFDQDPVQKERKIKDSVIKNRTGLPADDKESWNAIAQIIKKRILIYQFYRGFVHGFFEYGQEFSANGTKRICFEGYNSTEVCYRTLREAVSIDGKIIPIMVCSPDLLNTLQADIKSRLFKKEDKGVTWKAYLNQSSINSLELTDEENALIPTYIRASAHANGELFADDAASWETIAKNIKHHILVYEQQPEYIQGFYEYGKEFSQNGTKRVCSGSIYYQKLAEIGSCEEN